MSVGILIITHDTIGSSILSTAVKTFGFLPIPTLTVAINSAIDRQLSLCKIKHLIEDLDEGQGVLVMTDMYGATPCNVAQMLAEDERIQVVSGLNLPMLLRVFNYPGLDLDQMAEKALSGGRAGVVNCIECVI